MEAERVAGWYVRVHARVCLLRRECSARGFGGVVVHQLGWGWGQGGWVWGGGGGGKAAGLALQNGGGGGGKHSTSTNSPLQFRQGRFEKETKIAGACQTQSHRVTPRGAFWKISVAHKRGINPPPFFVANFRQNPMTSHFQKRPPPLPSTLYIAEHAWRVTDGAWGNRRRWGGLTNRAWKVANRSSRATNGI